MALNKTRKKRISKRVKSSWRHANINDVEEYLEDQRLEERLGFPLSTISNNDLFKVDINPTLEVSNKEKRKLKAKNPLKCFSALQPNTNVSDPLVKRNHVKTKEERKNELVKKKDIENSNKGILKHKEILANANRKLNELRRKRNFKNVFNKNLWDSDNLEVGQDEWISKSAKKHTLRGIGAPLKYVNKSKNRNSTLPAVEPPHPGMSYNPSFKDHQDLLNIVAHKEMKLIKEEEHLTRCTKGMFQKVSPDSRDQSWLVEMSEGLPSKRGTNIEENDVSSDERNVNYPVKKSKKTLKQRRKQREQLEMERKKKLIKLEKKKTTDICKLDVLNRNIMAIEKKQTVLQEKRLARAKEKKNSTKILSGTKFEQPDLEFNLSRDISGNLKNMKVEGNLLLDRFKSMQKRNILAPGKKYMRKKAKVKRYIKPGHRDENWKKTVAH